MHYVMFSKHDHTKLGTSDLPTPLFAYSSGAKARLVTQTAAFELRDFFDGESVVSYIENSQQGPLWIVFVGSKSFGTFFVQEDADDGVADLRVTFTPSFERIQDTIAELATNG